MSKTSMSMQNELVGASESNQPLSEGQTTFNATSEDTFSRRMPSKQFQ